MNVVEVHLHPGYFKYKTYDSGTNLALAKVVLDRRHQNHFWKLNNRLNKISLPNLEACKVQDPGAAISLHGYPSKTLQDQEGKKKLADNYNIYGMDGTLIKEEKKEGGIVAEYTDILATEGQSGAKLMLSSD